MVNLVNSPGKTQRIMRDATVSRMILKDFFDAAQIMDAKRYFAGSLGEISLRASGGKMLVSSRGFPLGRLNEAAMLTVGLQGNWKTTGLNLPEHAGWHRAVYANSGAKVAVLCQPVNACIMANKGRLPDKDVFIEAEQWLGDVQLVARMSCAWMQHCRRRVRCWRPVWVFLRGERKRMNCWLGSSCLSAAARSGSSRAALFNNNLLTDIFGYSKIVQPAWRGSSVVEQGTHKPLVVSSNLTLAIYFYLKI